jgi:hypothetical protein
MSVWVIVWSAALPVIALGNVVAWAMAAARHRRLRVLPARRELAVQRLQLLLSAGYVFGCAYRSVLPVFDVPRVALVGSVLSSAAVGRAVATVAELCFVAQWALLLREASKATSGSVGNLAARVVLPMIVLAEACSWYSVLSTSNLGHVFEETLWCMATALIVASLLAGWPRWGVPWHTAIAWLATAGIGYFLYLALVDVPMYWSRWVADEVAGKHYLSLAQGFLDASRPPVVSYGWNVWKSEMGWMAAYFSVAVWISIWLVHAPLPRSLSIVPAVIQSRGRAGKVALGGGAVVFLAGRNS